MIERPSALRPTQIASTARVDSHHHTLDRTISRRSAVACGAAMVLGMTVASRARGSAIHLQDASPRLPVGPGETIRGSLSGQPVFIPNVNEPPIPAIAPTGPVFNGERAPGFDAAALSAGHPDTCSWRRRLGLLIPATNTTMESELWSILIRNREHGLEGIGIHTSPVLTPKPDISSPEGLERYKKDFLAGVRKAVEVGMLARPQYLILGMSLEHIIAGMEPIRATMGELSRGCDLGWATWHDSAKAALDQFRAKRIGLITPFSREANDSAARMFRELGFEVVATFGFACGNAQHIAHIPNEAKERAITELLATPDNRLDAVVQCGTNMSMGAVAERLEPKLGIPILGINATLLWYALRESGIDGRVPHGGRLLREH